MADRAHLLRFERAAHLEHDRGRGLGLLAREQRPLRQHEMHARLLHAVDGADGARQLAFQRAQMVDVLHEARGAERVGLVEDLVADAAALGQAAFGELHAQPRDLLLRHQHDGAVVLDVVGDALPLQVLDDRRGVLDRQVGEQRRHLRRGGAHDQEGEKRHQREGDRAHRDDPRGAQGSEERNESLHGIPLNRRDGADPARIAQFMVTVRLTDVRQRTSGGSGHSTSAATLLSFGSMMTTLSSLTRKECDLSCGTLAETSTGIGCSGMPDGTVSPTSVGTLAA